MARPRKIARSLIDLPVRDRETGDVTVVVETPKAEEVAYAKKLIEADKQAQAEGRGSSRSTAR